MVREVYGRLLASLFPEACPRCGAAARAGYCAPCRADFARVRSPCRICGLARPVRRCPRLSPHWHLDAVVAPFDYAPPLAGELIRLKSGPGRRLGRALGALLAAHVAAAARHVDAIVPVPLHASRLRQRGFNQAAEIALALARPAGTRLDVHAAARVRATRLQAGLGRSHRAANLERVFRADARVAGLSIAIVDDVVTTGATVNALAAELRAAGAVHVQAWAVARTHAPADARAGAAQPPRNV